MKLPMQVFPCSLDVAPKQRTWISEAVEFFQNLVLDKHLGAFVKEKRMLLLLLYFKQLHIAVYCFLFIIKNQ